ncbi:MAG: nickel-responsive transcriptional regulator NikR [Candidatus Eisenbacteria bacterium]|jgi:CopG family nickel-responsive transcriptional regulator|nr:nickel-responsive transcriptional regulator NikR [Candidatus Eisenbacteria bacterium]
MKTEQETVRFGVSLPQELLRELDERIVARGYSSRSEFIRDLIRAQLVEEKWRTGSEPVVGVLSIVYDHHQRDLVNRIMDAQHAHYVQTVCTTHVHLDHDNCLEVIIIQGKAEEIERLNIEISGLRGVRFAELTRASKVEI